MNLFRYEIMNLLSMEFGCGSNGFVSRLQPCLENWFFV